MYFVAKVVPCPGPQKANSSQLVLVVSGSCMVNNLPDVEAFNRNTNIGVNRNVWLKTPKKQQMKGLRTGMY